MMDKRTAKKLNKEISLLGMGLMRLPEKNKEIDYKQAQEIIDACMQGGVNYYDTAYIYHNGKSETFLKEALVKRYSRDSFFLADKLPFWKLRTLADAQRIFREQLDRTGAGHFDIYMLHGLDEKTWEQTKELKILDYLIQNKKDGLIRHIGFSSHDKPGSFKKILSEFDWESVLIQINYYDWFSDSGAKENYEELKKRGIPCFVMEPVMGGSLARPIPKAAQILSNAFPDESFAEIALRFVGGLPGVTSVLSGMSTLAQVQENIATLTNVKPIADSELKELERVYDYLKDVNGVPCTGCKYCDCCPNGIRIAEIFEAYNSYVRFDNPDPLLWQFKEEIPESSRAKGCTRCGECEKICPQGIAVMDELLHIEEEFTKLG
jgi:predicted aldo/keto reductase-like oxidoreductase